MIAPDDFFRELPRLDTPRLIMRPLSIDDADDVFDYARRPEVPRFMPWAPHRTRDDAVRFLKDQIDLAAQGKPNPWGFVHKDEGRLIGAGGFNNWRYQDRVGEVGYALSPDFWGQGLMTEAVSEMVRLGFEELGMQRIQARATPDNVASWRVMEKVGMVREGLLRADTYIDGEPEDHFVYAIVLEDYPKRRQ